MDMAEGKQRVERLLSRGGVRRVTWVKETRHPGTGGATSLTGDYPRILLGLSGRRPLRVIQMGQPRRVILGVGDCLVLGPHTWLLMEPGGSFCSIGLVLEARNPRVVLVRQAHRAEKNRSTAVHIVPGLCNSITMHLAAALLDAGVGSDEGLYVRRLAESLWLRALRDRGASRTPDSGKAFVTYSAAEHYVRENFARSISRDEVANFLRIHPSHITRLFLQFAGETFGGFLLRVRLESARSLLSDPRLTVSEVGYLSGFTSPNYFVRAYRRCYRATPGKSRGGLTSQPE
jgi:AraC-like DNA-binding protein